MSSVITHFTKPLIVKMMGDQLSGTSLVQRRLDHPFIAMGRPIAIKGGPVR